MTSTTHVGIDPGGSGGIAILFGDSVIEAIPIPDSCADLLYWMKRKLEFRSDPIYIIMEKVQGFIGNRGNKDGGFGNPGSAMFEFGKVYGRLEMMLYALKELGFKFQHDVVPPNTWQRAMKIPPRVSRGPNKESKGQHKAKLARIARTYFPQRAVTLETADALLLAKYSKEVYKWTTISDPRNSGVT